MKILLLLTACLYASCSTFAQADSSRYVDGRDLMIIGKGFPTDPTWVRLDTMLDKRLTPAVKDLSKHSAGIAVLFETNSPYIRAKWSIIKRRFAANMTPIAHSGVDLYAYQNGHWQYVSVGRPNDKDTAFNELVINNMDGVNRQYMLYLPLYNQATGIAIGVAPNATLVKPSAPKIDTTKRVVIYGSSILHGASASRAGMAYPSIISRRTGWEMINLGFSGNGLMEMEIAEMLATMKASVFVLDCIPNPSPAMLRERGYPFIKYLLTKRPEVPVLLIETSLRQNGFFDQKIGNTITEKNKIVRGIYEKLKKEGFKQLHYLKGDDLLGKDHEATVDGVHHTDLGFMRQAEMILPELQKLMK